MKVISLIFFAALSLSVTAQERFQRNRIPNVELCKLLKSAETYKNKTVRVRVVYHSWFEGSALSNNCAGESSVWVYFPDSVNSQSKPEIAERLEDVFFRYLPGAKAGSGTFNSFRTELTITGKITHSKKKPFGIHGGYAYLFTVAVVEHIGTTEIRDYEAGKTTVYIAESSEQRQARHAKEAEWVCQLNSEALDMVLTEFESPGEEITLEARLGAGERSRALNHLRLETIRDYFINCAGVPANKLIMHEGERTNVEGRVSVYRAGKLSKTLLAAPGMNICLRPC